MRFPPLAEKKSARTEQRALFPVAHALCKHERKRFHEKKKKAKQFVSQGRTAVGWTMGSAGVLPSRSLLMPSAVNTGVLCSGPPGELRSRRGG